jgi:hypothetical protein
VSGEVDAVSAIRGLTAPTPGSVTVGSATIGGNAGHQYGQRTQSPVNTNVIMNATDSQNSIATLTPAL